MRSGTGRRGAALVAALFAAVAVTACAADVPEADPADDGADALVWTGDDVDLDGAELAIGSKESVENEVLGWIAVEAARAAGASVHQEIGAGGTAVVRQAQLSGLIDAYWEYTGTGWQAILDQSNPAGTPDELYEDVRDRDARLNQIDWLPPAPANSAYAFAATSETIDELGVRTLADLAEAIEREDAGPSICLDEESGFADDPEGLRQFEEAFGVQVEPTASLATDELYEQVEAGLFCQVGQVLNTDPRLAAGSIEVLEDAGTFTIYNPSMTIRQDVVAEAAGFEQLVAQLSPRLTDEVVRALRAEVELEGTPAREVARAWLTDEGLVQAPSTTTQEGEG
ncbi:MAG TPA: glycine betaine ABC transporter substrate-binding protein [Acidimicrobiales bacterium]|nr:glycine betaine ABC transporter substrate-binding protein [Acidimicrobiales bacterium]